jgi:hypothetical protein
MARSLMHPTTISLAVLVTAAFVTTTYADTLPIKGSYGNKDGCAYAKSGESTGSEDFFLLTSEAITTATSVCTIKTLAKTDGKSFMAKVSCQAEGEDGETGDTAKINYSTKGYTIGFTSDARIKWGPLPLCK